jgi:hypothetical protein
MGGEEEDTASEGAGSVGVVGEEEEEDTASEGAGSISLVGRLW